MLAVKLFLRDTLSVVDYFTILILIGHYCSLRCALLETVISNLECLWRFSCYELTPGFFCLLEFSLSTFDTWKRHKFGKLLLISMKSTYSISRARLSRARSICEKPVFTFLE